MRILIATVALFGNTSCNARMFKKKKKTTKTNKQTRLFLTTLTYKVATGTDLLHGRFTDIECSHKWLSKMRHFLINVKIK